MDHNCCVQTTTSSVFARGCPKSLCGIVWWILGFCKEIFFEIRDTLANPSAGRQEFLLWLRTHLQPTTKPTQLEKALRSSREIGSADIGQFWVENDNY